MCLQSDIDQKGRTPLQTCLDHKKHNWQSVVQMLEDARPVPTPVPHPESPDAAKVTNSVTHDRMHA